MKKTKLLLIGISFYIPIGYLLLKLLGINIFESVKGLLLSLIFILLPVIFIIEGKEEKVIDGEVWHKHNYKYYIGVTIIYFDLFILLCYLRFLNK